MIEKSLVFQICSSSGGMQFIGILIIARSDYWISSNKEALKCYYDFIEFFYLELNFLRFLLSCYLLCDQNIRILTPLAPNTAF